MSKELIEQARALADKFSEGWHDGIQIDATDVMTLSELASTLEAAEARIAELEATVEAQRTLYSNCTEIARRLEIAREALHYISDFSKIYGGEAMRFRPTVDAALAKLGDGK